MNAPEIVVWSGVACLAIGIAWLTWQQSRGRIDLVDTITKWDAERGCRTASIEKIGEAVILFVSSWVLVYDSLDGVVNEWLAAVVITPWVARYAFWKLLQARAGMIDAATSAVRDGK